MRLARSPREYWSDRVAVAFEIWRASLSLTVKRPTQGEFARDVGVTSSLVSKWLNSKAGPPTAPTARSMDDAWSRLVERGKMPASALSGAYFFDAWSDAEDLKRVQPLLWHITRDPRTPDDPPPTDLDRPDIQADWTIPPTYYGNWLADTYVWWQTAGLLPADSVRYVERAPELTIGSFTEEITARSTDEQLVKSGLLAALQASSDADDLKLNRRKLTFEAGELWMTNPVEFTKPWMLPVRRMTFELGRAMGPDPAKDEDRGGLPRQRRFLDALSGIVSVTLDDPDKIPWPASFAVHTLAVTADGWVLASLRGSNPFATRNTWSLSFEENAEYGDPPSTRDDTIGDTVRRGFPRETADSLRDALGPLALVGLGRVMNLDSDYLGPVAFVIAQLYVTKDEFKKAVDSPDGAVDQEHDAFAFLRIQTDKQALDLIRENKRGPKVDSNGDFALDGVESDDIDILWLPGRSPIVAGWHPSAFIRLFLWARFARWVHPA